MGEGTFLDRLAENLLEGSFNRLLKPKLQPVQIAKALVRAMERGQMVGTDGPLAPSLFRVYLHPEDLAAISSYQSGLEREMAAYLVSRAGKKGIRFLSGPVVSLLPEDRRSRTGQVRVEGSMVDIAPDPAPEQPVGPGRPWEGTVEMPVAPQPTKTTAEAPAAILVDEGGQSIPLSGSEISIGRAIDNDIVLETTEASRQHAKIVREASQYLLLDLGSTNGSFVAGQRVTRHVLSEGDCLTLGGVRFTFHLAAQPQG